MKRWNLRIELKSDFCTATGESASGMIHVKTALEYGVPFIPAKRIKGCLLEAGKEMADNGVIDRDILCRIFGRPGMESGEGIHICDGHISSVPEYLFDQRKEGQITVENYERFQNAIRCHPQINASLVEDIFTRRRTRTAMEEETGTAEKHSLRTVQVVPSRIVFSSCLEGKLSREEAEALRLCAKGLRHMGIGITRGLGEICCIMEEVQCKELEIIKESMKLFEAFMPEEEVRLSYEIELVQPMVVSDGQKEGTDQIPAGAVLGALAGMYIKKYSLGADAHEDEDFRRIFLRDGVQFGNGFFQKDGIEYGPCPKAVVLKKDDKTAWFHIAADKKKLRRKSISGQTSFKNNTLYIAKPQKEIHFHHARPVDRGIAHAQNDRAEDTSIPTGQFFQYIALAKGQSFTGTWKGTAKDIQILIGCLEDHQFHLMLGKSKTAEYGRCVFRVLGVDSMKRHEVSGKGGTEWMVWLLSPLVYRNPAGGAYDTGSSQLFRQMGERLGCELEVTDSFCSYTVVDGYNSKWKLPQVPCPALAAGSTSSPLSVGSGEQEQSDSDVALNAKGMPYIPGSSLAGALREYADAMNGKIKADQLFGASKNGKPGSEDDRQSRIFVYDAVILQAETAVRDGVRLNENKAASHMGKYERQFIERGAFLKIRIEILEREDCLKDTKRICDIWEEDLQWIKLLLYGFSNGELRLGARSRRGFGKIEINQARVRKFDMREKASYLEWLDWDWEKADAFCGPLCGTIGVDDMETERKSGLEHCIKVPLHISGTFLVRTYHTVFSKTKELPDYGQMTVGGKGDQALIPGSSWAGAFRSQIAEIVKELGQLSSWNEAQKKLEPLFGTWADVREKTQEFHASRVTFEETVIDGGHALPTARIAVDRFTGGTVQSALYEEAPWAGGTAALEIRWKKTEGALSDKAVCGMLLWAIKDLQAGILAVGGETSVGRGIFEPQMEQADILKDGEVLCEEEQRECMQAAAFWVRDVRKNQSAGR